MAADDLIGRAVVKRRGVGNEARVGRQQEAEADLGFAGLARYKL
jgi:hypothetical protein